MKWPDHSGFCSSGAFEAVEARETAQRWRREALIFLRRGDRPYHRKFMIWAIEEWKRFRSLRKWSSELGFDWSDWDRRWKNG